ncbi:MFS transporter [Kitasatospora sp. GP82]|uniref:MFS transporter n=1 Tax=Kitasatospora sp. GP82 TaxID=3035089 RepID=UPI0024740D61|nr:MFS transporter [Kitasatospora sp. GP82]MDH6128201.1 sugar phosphate permease [Kitasatospora sp. GP82]
MSSAALAGRFSGYRWVILAIATFAQASACFFVQGIGAISGFLQRDLQLSTSQVGLLVSAAQLVPLVGLLVAGELLDRYSERWVVGIGTLAVALALLAGSLATGYLSLLLFLIVVGAGYSTAQPGGSKSVATWFAASQRGFAMGIRQAGLPLGGALAAALLPYLADHLGWRSSLATGGLVALLGAGVFMGFYRTPESQVPEPATAPVGKASGRSLRAELGSRLAMIREPSMLNIVLSGTSLIAVQYGILVLTELYLHDKASMRIEQGALYLLVAQCAGIAGRISLAAWSDRCKSGRYVPVLVCMSAVVLGLVGLMTVPLHSALAVGGLFAWLGFFGFGWYGPWVTYVAESAASGKSGFALGFAMAVNQIAVILTPPALGFLKDLTHSYTPGWSVLAAMTLVALVTTTWKARAIRRTEASTRMRG